MKNQTILLTSFSLLVIFSLSPQAFAHPHTGQIQIDSHTHEPQTQYYPIDGKIGIEKTSLLFHAPSDNSLPWGFIEGKIKDPVAGYPVIIQIYEEDGNAVHFAQTDVNDDGTYEYKFRVLSIEGDKAIKIFNGDYHVSIFKVVYLDQKNVI